MTLRAGEPTSLRGRTWALRLEAPAAPSEQARSSPSPSDSPARSRARLAEDPSSYDAADYLLQPARHHPSETLRVSDTLPRWL